MRAGVLCVLLCSGCVPVVEEPDRGALDVVINEIQADNVTTLADESGGFDDWIELHNTGAVDADLTGHSLTDDLGAPRKWAFPDDTTIPAGGYLLVWADGEDDGPLHASFKLSSGGEEVGLFGPLDGGGVRIDAGEFGPQDPDLSIARMPDGALDWETDASPTPGAANE